MEGFTTKKQPFTTGMEDAYCGRCAVVSGAGSGTVYTDLLRNGQMEDPFLERQ